MTKLWQNYDKISKMLLLKSQSSFQISKFVLIKQRSALIDQFNKFIKKCHTILPSWHKSLVCSKQMNWSILNRNRQEKRVKVLLGLFCFRPKIVWKLRLWVHSSCTEYLKHEFCHEVFEISTQLRPHLKEGDMILLQTEDAGLKLGFLTP